MADAPHFAYPLQRSTGGHVATVEQETLDEIEACVMVVAHARVGDIDGLPDFGTPDWTFREQPVGPEEIEEAILRSEPRAQLIVEEDPDRWDALLDRVTVTVGGGQRG